VSNRTPISLVLSAILAWGVACGGSGGPSVATADLPGIAETVSDAAGREIDTTAVEETSPVDGTFDPVATPDSHADAPSCLHSSNCDPGFLCVGGTCVPGCVSDRDCVTPMFCLATLGPNGTCVTCRDSKDCDISEDCAFHVCARRCAGDGDCAALVATPRCDLTLNNCVACFADTHCPIGSVCTWGACIAGCHADRDCADGMICDTTVQPAGACYECLSDADCTSPATCRSHQCQVDCSTIQCQAPTPVCLPHNGACVQCAGKADCVLGQVCQANACVTGCATDADCPGRHCDPTGTGACADCVTDDQCPSGQKCLSGTCGVPPCNVDGDCAFGTYCQPLLKQCQPLPSGACTSGKCGIGQACDTLTRKCIPTCGVGCNFWGDSPDRTMCVDGACYGCQADADCNGVPCSPQDRMCHGCQSDGDCATAGWLCDKASGACHQCLKAPDCKDAANPKCGNDGLCCHDACTDGATQCGADGTAQECGRWNGACLSWSITTCGSLASCSRGTCVCQNECSVDNPQGCTTEWNKYWICRAYASSGCLNRETHMCFQNQPNQYCDANGYCIAN